DFHVTGVQTCALPIYPDFTLANPNRVRSLIGAFAANQRALHHESGRGYRLLADILLAADRINPQVAARLVPPLGRWRRFDEKRADRKSVVEGKADSAA